MLQKFKQFVAILLLPMLVAACADSVSAPGAPTTQAAPLAGLPDFTPLVQKQGAAVVNISTTNNLKMNPGNEEPEIPGIPEDHPLYEFFKRFGAPEGFEGVPRGNPGPLQGSGSGFIISDDGYILTSAHVVAIADEVTVALTDKREFKAKVIGVDRRTDIALLKIDATGLPK